MLGREKIPGYLSTAEAAEVLGCTAHQIASLVRSGEIRALRSAGDAFLIEATSLKRYKQISGGKGRPLSSKMAYALLWSLSDLEIDWLDYAQMRRLHLKLARYSANDLVWQSRKKALRKTYRASLSFLPNIQSALIASGASAIETYGFDLTSKDGSAEGYLLAKDEENLVARNFLVEDPNGNVVLHIAEWLPSDLGRCMPEAVVAADLASSLDTRERRAGLDRLEMLLHDYTEN